MGLRCLLGHDFGEVQTSRDREERGNEVVVTVREYRECDRCGETRVVSENTEVRTTATHDEDPGPADGREDLRAGAASPATPDEEGSGLEEVSAEEDDGVILPDEPEEPRQPGEWPAATEDEPEPSGEPTPWPEVEGEDEGFAAEPSDGGPAEGVEFRGGLTPETSAADLEAAGSTEGENDVVEAATEPGDSGSGIRRARPSVTPVSDRRPGPSDTEFFCPECGHTAPAEGSSLRPGDICPQCRLGYLTERER